MGSFYALVPMDRYVLECCDTAVNVDRAMYPHQRKSGEGCWTGPFDAYSIVHDDHDHHFLVPEKYAPAAFVDTAGNWRSQYLPEDVGFERDYPELAKAHADPESGDLDLLMPLEKWHEEVREWLGDLSSGLHPGYRIVIVRCHD